MTMRRRRRGPVRRKSERAPLEECSLCDNRRIVPDPDHPVPGTMKRCVCTKGREKQDKVPNQVQGGPDYKRRASGELD